MKPSSVILFFCTYVLLLSFLFAQPEPGDFYWYGPNKEEKKVALTFDDGPGKFTPQFLELLKKYDAKATFFVLGKQAKNNPLFLSQIKEHGHEIGSHTWGHINYYGRYNELKNEKKSEKEITTLLKHELSTDLIKTKQAIEAINHEPVRLLRMPHGVDRPWIKDVAKDVGHILVNWTFGQDWMDEPVSKLKDSYLNALQPGAILLFHDGGANRERSLQLLESVLEKGQQEGYSFVSAGDLIGATP